MNLRAASLFFALVFAALSAQAQGHGGGPPAGAGGPIQSLASDLAALTARVAKLEGQIVAADLAGTYAVHGIQNELLANSPGGFPTQVSSYVFLGTIVLGTDGSASLSGTQSGHTLFIGPPSSRSPIQSNFVSPSTWTYANGIVTIPGGAPPLSVAAGGRVLIGASANHTDGTDVLLILTRLQ